MRFNLCLFASLIIALNQAHSTDWMSLDVNDRKKSDYYVDQDTISEDAPFVKVWVLENKNQNKIHTHSTHRQSRKNAALNRNYQSSVSMYVIDCERETTAVVRGLYFSESMGKGVLLKSFRKEVDFETLKPIKTNTLSSAVVSFICSRASNNSKIQT